LKVPTKVTGPVNVPVKTVPEGTKTLPLLEILKAPPPAKVQESVVEVVLWLRRAPVE
jgi:hypothetical protein